MTVATVHPSRRGFLRSAAWTALGGLSLLAAPPLIRPAAAERLDRTLVLLHLSGGNDGLNTVVPYADPAYRALRPGLAVGREAVLPLDATLGLNAALEPLWPSWLGGEMAIALGVGYDEPNFSHFRASDIWNTASGSDQTLTEGWIARLMRGVAWPADQVAEGVAIGAGADVLAAPDTRSVVLQRGGPLSTVAPAATPAPGAVDNAALAHVVRVQRDGAAAAEAFAGVHRLPLAVEFPATSIGRNLALAARVVLSGIPVPAIVTAQTGYDTHTGQGERHRRCLTELGAALAAFRDVLMLAGRWDDVLVMTHAEFGRRAAENGSGGTDHGTAAPHFVLGGRVAGGLYGQQPSLVDLEGDNLRHGLDYRRLYASVARDWWGLPADLAADVLGAHRPLGLVRGAAA